MPGQPSQPPPPFVFWTIWCAMISGVVLLRVFIPAAGRDPATQTGWGGIECVALAALAASLLARWVVLPRLRTLREKFPVFLAACALSEACAILGVFFSRARGGELFAAGLAGLLLVAPLFALPRAETFPRPE